MDHQIVKIHQDPKALLETFHPQGFDPGFTQGLFQMFGQGENVAPGSAGTDQEIIGKGTEPLHFQGDGVQALDCVNSLDRLF